MLKAGTARDAVLMGPNAALLPTAENLRDVCDVGGALGPSDLGFPYQALALVRDAVILGEGPKNRYTYTALLYWAGLTHILRRSGGAEELFAGRSTLALRADFLWSER